MIVIVAGSRAIPPGEVGRMVVDLLGRLPPDTTILLREGKFKEPGEFERMVDMVCELMGIKVEWRQVEITAELWGRKAVFARDLQMAADCDLAVCFTTTEQAYDMECGSTALAQKVLEADKAVYHYAVDAMRFMDRDNHLMLIGSHDTDKKFARYFSA